MWGRRENTHTNPPQSLHETQLQIDDDHIDDDDHNDDDNTETKTKLMITTKATTRMEMMIKQNPNWMKMVV